MECSEIVVLWILAWVIFIAIAYFFINWALNNFVERNSDTKEYQIRKFLSCFYILCLIAFLEFVGLIWQLIGAISTRSFRYETFLNFNTTLNFIFSPKESTLQYGNEICKLSSNSSFSIENFSIIISAISGILILTYFLGLIESSSNLFSDRQEEGKKYFLFFISITLLSVPIVFSMLASIFFSYLNNSPNNYSNFDYGLILLALINIWVVIRFVKEYKNFRNNYELLESYNYFLDEMSKKTSSESVSPKINQYLLNLNVFSGFIFITMILTAFYSYAIKDVNVFSVIFFESSLVFLHIGISRIYLMPRRKYNFELNNLSIIKNAFILFDTTDYYRIICPKNQNRQIMKQSISQIIEIKNFK